jgi:hypothetical protein
MLPYAANELHFEVSVSIIVSDPKHRLVSGVLVEASSGKVTINIKLENVKGQLYRYDGEVQAKPVKGEFRTKSVDGLASDLTTATLFKKRLGESKGYEFKLEEYIPSLDPTAPSEVIYRHEAGQPSRTARMKFGDIEAAAMLDDDGLFSEVRLPAGAVEIELRRELKKGKL